MDVSTTLLFAVAHAVQLATIWFLIEQLHGAIKRIRRLERRARAAKEEGAK